MDEPQTARKLRINIIAISSLLLTTHSVSADDLNSTSDNFYNTDSDWNINKSDILFPMSSFLLPGLGQWTSQHYAYATTYTGIATAGVAYAYNASYDYKTHEASKDSNEFDTKDIALRKMTLGLQTYQSMGGLSLFHTFRTAAQMRKKDGQYGFLATEDRPADLLLAPFDFSHLARASTWVPLSIGSVASYWIATHLSDGWQPDSFRREDAAFAAGFSFNAGTHEEAVFRGWLMPALHEYGMNEPWANGAQASLFAIAHLNNNPFPIAQLAFGWHLGSVTQANGWSLKESIFIHTWWDIIAMTASYHMKKTQGSTATPARLYLSPVTLYF